MNTSSDSPLSPDQAEQRLAARRNLRHILVAWIFGAGWAALVSGAPFIRFGEEMGLRSRPFVWGLLAAMPYLGTFFQLAGSWWVERHGGRKRVFVIALLTQRLTWLAIATLPWLVAPGSLAAVLVVLGLVALHATGGAVGTPAWTSWMADVIPTRVRGRYFGRRTQMGMMTLIPLALLAGWLLHSARVEQIALPRPLAWNDWTLAHFTFNVSQLHLCSGLFAVGALLGLVDILMFLPVPDRWAPPAGAPTLREIFGPPLRNPAFRRFLTYYFFFTLAVPGIGYYVWLYVLNRVNVGEAWAQAIFMGGGGLGAILAAGVWGRLIDRFGRYTVWRIAYVIPILLPIIYGAIQPAFWWLAFAVAFVDGVCWNGVEQSNFNGLLHFSTSQPGRATSSGYQAIFAMVMALAGTISGLMFGGLSRLAQDWTASLGTMQFSYFHVVFAAATLIRLVVYVTMLPLLREPAAQPVGRAVQFLLTGTYQRIAGLLTFPWRLVSAAAPRRPGDSVDDEAA